MTVYVARRDRYDVASIKGDLEKAIHELGFSFDGKSSAFIKPNIVLPGKPDSAIVTHPAVTEAVVDVLRSYGFIEITVGDGVGVGQDAAKSFRESGYEDMCRRLDVRLVDLDTEDRVEVSWKYRSLSLPKIALESDLYVDLAKIKTHGQSRVTLALKNQKGLLLPQDKKNFHVEWGLSEPIAELYNVVKPDLSIIDGIVGMEGDGPINGKRKQVGVLVIGEDAVEVDSVCCKIIGQDPLEVEHIKFALDSNPDSGKPEVLGTPIEEVKTDFTPANQEYGHKLGIYSWRNPNACSMCIQNFSDAFWMAFKKPRYWHKLPRFAYYVFVGRLHLVQGRGACIPDQRGRVVCMGNCTAQLAQEHKVTHVPGCPPKPEDILKNI